jgi:hypothetical protein
MATFDAQAIATLKAIHKAEWNEDLSDDEARALGERLLGLFVILCKVRSDAPRID